MYHQTETGCHISSKTNAYTRSKSNEASFLLEFIFPSEEYDITWVMGEHETRSYSKIE